MSDMGSEDWNQRYTFLSVGLLHVEPLLVLLWQQRSDSFAPSPSDTSVIVEYTACYLPSCPN
jgi:hypothetical protein